MKFFRCHLAIAGLLCALACQPSADPLALPVRAGDLVMIALDPFPDVITQHAPSVSSYSISTSDPLQWTFIESRNPEPSRLSWVSNESGALVIATSTRAQELLVWHASMADFQFPPLDNEVIFRVRGDKAADGGYRCRLEEGCPVGNEFGIGPIRGGSCLISQLGDALFFRRDGDTWTQHAHDMLDDYALELQHSGTEPCVSKGTPWARPPP
jgi:hypothetical protein